MCDFTLAYWVRGGWYYFTPVATHGHVCLILKGGSFLSSPSVIEFAIEVDKNYPPCHLQLQVKKWFDTGFFFRTSAPLRPAPH